MIYVSPTEHEALKYLKSSTITYKISRICEDNGADFIVPTKKGFCAYQRKTLPDLSASLVDGRLYKEFAQLKSSPVVQYPFLLLEYDPSKVTTDGSYLQADIPVTTVKSIILKAQLLGVYYGQSVSVRDSIEYIISSSSYVEKSHSTSIRRVDKNDSKWGTRNNRDFQLYLLQSFPGIGPVAANAIINHFDEIPLKFTVSVNQLARVRGIGIKTAKRIYSVLNEFPA